MVTLPAATPLTTPVAGLTVAKAALLLLQVPPLTASVNVMVEPAHTDDGPLIAPAVGAAVIVTVVVAVAVPQLLVTV